jgi:lipopolysaccharide/colanic/teichoic acid biosynthesis glycosyltransferase/glycosyltransferase involved in cell wall biosynthesis
MMATGRMSNRTPASRDADRCADATSAQPLVTHITTVAMTLLFLRGQARFMRSRGFEFDVVSSPGDHQDEFASSERVRAYGVPMERRIAPARDLGAVFMLVRVLLRTRPAIVHAYTPKAGLLGMMAATVCRVPLRVYEMYGLPLTTATGATRWLLWLSECVACALAHEVICCSESLRQLTLANRICRPSKAQVIANGSAGGVDAVCRFNPSSVPTEEAAAVRRDFGIASDAVVIGFVGRLVPDKGVSELAAAWQSLRAEFPAVHLLLVGPFEDASLPHETRRVLEEDPRVHLTGPDWNTPRLFAAMDVVCLPSYREGFPVVCLEAAAMAKPVVATRVTGCVDAVADGLTGTLVPARNSDALSTALRDYVSDPELRRRHGSAGRARMLADFAPERTWAGIADVYTRALRARRVNHTVYQRFGKRLLDVLLSASGLVASTPILLAVAIAVLLKDGRPVLFRQMRPGRMAAPFRLIKFRTMRDEPVGAPDPGTDADRLTSLGRFLRATSLDELPELWNVLKGDMSLVGPRPLLMRYLDRYTPEQARRHDVRPGVTGLAQVAGRNALTWEQKFAWDLEYVDRCSFRLDIKILALTVGQVLARRNTHEPGHATAREFMGTRSR